MSSAKQTDRKPDSGRKAGDAGAVKPGSPSVLWLVWLVPLLAGWLFVLRIYNWHLVPPALLLASGWLAMLATAGFLLQAGIAATSGAADGDQEFWRPEGRRDELLREKKALLKAIKEIEFDHELGKMSDEDAVRLSRFYRARAIEIIKVLEGKGEPAGACPHEHASGMSPAERIERDVAERLASAQRSEKSEAVEEDAKQESGSDEKGAGE